MSRGILGEFMGYDEENHLPRGKVVGSLGAILAAVVSRTRAAQSSPAKTAEPQELHDPTTKYPKQPFKSESQPWPGLAAKMEPKPGLAGASYKGSGCLARPKALTTGGDSGMVHAATIAYTSIYVQFAASDASYATGQVYGRAGGSGQP